MGKSVHDAHIMPSREKWRNQGSTFLMSLNGKCVYACAVELYDFWKYISAGKSLCLGIHVPNFLSIWYISNNVKQVKISLS